MLAIYNKLEGRLIISLCNYEADLVMTGLAAWISDYETTKRNRRIEDAKKILARIETACLYNKPECDECTEKTCSWKLEEALSNGDV